MLGEANAVQDCAERFVIVRLRALRRRNLFAWARRGAEEGKQALWLHDGDQPVGFLAAGGRIVAQIRGKFSAESSYRL